ncbi:MAG: antitoxin component YwqK of YwqJK toxin-antitoxin module [Flavobacteriales bacterium]|jgi:antitoxin component YwqK of YwqJK toxin-antitoxin module
MKTILSLLLIIFSNASFAQDLNNVDENGLKQGVWEKKFSNGELRYKGQFKDNAAYGEFLYYSPYKYLIAKTNFKDAMVSYTTMYYKKGKMRAYGKNLNEKKDSIWIFFDEKEVHVSSVDYVKGIKHGYENVFFEDGTLIETINWEQGEKSGEWKQYYNNGAIRISGTYVNDQLNGPVTLSNLDGKVNAKGTYKNGLKEGVWGFYTLEGELESKEWYSVGKVIKREGSNLQLWQE